MSDLDSSRTDAGVDSSVQEIDKNRLIQEAINSVLRISLEPISLDEQMQRILDIIIHLPWLALEAKGCIFLVDDDAKHLVMKAHIGMPVGALAACRRVPFGTCLCGRAIADNEIVFASCVNGCHTVRYLGIHPHGHYCVPIGCDGRRVGLLNLYVREGRKQSPVEERFLRAVADVLAQIIELQRTQQRLQEQLRLATFGKDVGLALCQGVGLPDMLRRSVEAMVRHLDGALARIWTLNEADNVLELQASAGLYTHIDGAHRRVPVGQYKIGLIAQERKPHLTNNVLADSRVHDQEWARCESMVAFAGYPLLVEDRLVGVMAMFARQLLSAATLDAMASIANGIALGIERKRTQERLLEQLSERKKAGRRLAAEHGVSRILAVSDNLNDAASSVLQSLCERLDWDVGTVWVVDAKDNVLRCIENWHRPGVEVAAFEGVTRQCTFAPGVGLPGRVWASEDLVWVSDVSVDANSPRFQVAAQCGLHGAVGFPIGDDVLGQGVLEFFGREIRQPDDELIEMMTCIGNQISQFIEHRQAQEANRRQAQDRRLARQIQQGLLPKTMPRLPGFQIGAKSLTAADVGGDCFDFLPFLAQGQDCFGVIVADASGHGMAAALLVAQARAYLRALSIAYAEVDHLLTLTNFRLTADIVTDHFVSLFLMQLDPRTRSLVYASAGHCPGHVLDRQGQIKTVLASTGTLVGIDQASAFSTGPALTLESGDLLLLFTDGIVEAGSADGKFFGLKRTLDVVRCHQDKTPDDILEALFDAVRGFSQQPLEDDATAVIIKVE